VGINTAIIASAQGMGFAVPSNTARHVVSQILTYGKVRRGYLGISGRQRQLSRRFARFFNLSRESGVEVVSLDPQGPAKRSDILPGDILVEMNGHPVESVDDLHRLLSDMAVGGMVRIALVRGTEWKVANVEIGESAA
jgi:S1-C subfamily serine protease